MAVLRVLIAFVLATSVTFGLFLFMQSLIALSEMALDDSGRTKIVDFVRLKRESNTRTKKRELPSKAQPKAEPKSPKMDLPKGGAQVGATSIQVSAPTLDTSVKMSGGLKLGAAPADGDIAPMVRVDPIYPRDAQQRGIEGWVKLKFSISTTGSVKNATVLASQPARIFDTAALRAVKKWRYKPKISDGKPVERHNVKVRLSFKLNN